MAATHGINIWLKAGKTPGTGTLNITSTTANTETVTIGSRVYEFCTDGNVTDGRVLVDISGGNSYIQSATALGAAINADEFSPVTAIVHDNTGNADVHVTSKHVGTGANSTATTELVSNATWGAATLTGGTDAAVALERNSTIRVNGELVDITTKSNSYWRTFLPSWLDAEVTCSGLLSIGEAGQEALYDALTTNRPLTAWFMLNSGGTVYYTGTFYLTALEQSGAHDGAGEFSATLKLDGALTPNA